MITGTPTGPRCRMSRLVGPPGGSTAGARSSPPPAPGGGRPWAARPSGGAILRTAPGSRQGAFADRPPGSARLHCTNIVPVFGVGRAVDTHFHVMQYIDGRGLDCLLEDVRHRPPATQLP